MLDGTRNYSIGCSTSLNIEPVTRRLIPICDDFLSLSSTGIKIFNESKDHIKVDTERFS